MTTNLVSAVQTSEVTRLAAAIDSGSRNRPLARLSSHWPTSSLAVIRTHGDIDASNADELTEYAMAHMTRCRKLVLDLSDAQFFGTEGFLALHRVSVSCARVGSGWAVVPGLAGSRVLRICDPQGSLPTADTVETAIAVLRGRPSAPSPSVPVLDGGPVSACASPADSRGARR